MACWPAWAYNEDGKTFAGMGTDFNDYDNDGRPTSWSLIFPTSAICCFAITARHLSGCDEPLPALGAATLAFPGWSTHLFDYDNDGWKDLFVAQAHVMDTIQKTSPNLPYLQPPLAVAKRVRTLRG